MAELPTEIHGVLIPVTNARLLLPNAVIAEIVSYSTPAKFAKAPDWLLGSIPWRGSNLPLFSFAALSGAAQTENVGNARIAVLKGLGGDARLPFVALLAQGFPRLIDVLPDSLVSAGSDGEHTPGVRTRVLIRSDHAIVPDLDGIENMILEALAA